MAVTPLYPAAGQGHGDAVKLLELPDQDVNSKNVNDETPLYHAILNAHTDVGMSRRTPLSRTAGRGHAAIVSLLLQREEIGVNLADCKVPPLWAVAFFATQGPVTSATFFASDISHIHITEYDGDDVRYADKRPVPVPYCRAKTVVDLLLRQPDTCVNWKDGQTLLLVAAKNNLESLTEWLLNRNDIDINEQDEKKDSPLHHAARFGHVKVVSLLLHQDRTAVNLQNATGQTPLHSAIVAMNDLSQQFPNVSPETQEAIVKPLLAHEDVRPHLEDDNNASTPLEFARTIGATAIVSLLEPHIEESIHGRRKRTGYPSRELLDDRVRSNRRMDISCILNCRGDAEGNGMHSTPSPVEVLSHVPMFLPTIPHAGAPGNQPED